MLLLIDIGNSNITFGISDNRDVLNTLRVDTKLTEDKAGHYQKVLDNLIEKYDMPRIDGAVICSVVPEVSPMIIDAVKERFNIVPIIVDITIKNGLRFTINNLHTLGADRIANAAAAYKLYSGNLIVIDFGTATTLCAITDNGEYIGGAIMPGIGISAESLHEKTSGLPLVELKIPKTIPGKDTTDNILTGIVLGHAGAAERIIHEISKEENNSFSVIATGGYAGLVAPFVKKIDYIHPSLTLDGLRILYQLNS
jgi:type III pantothenate kinase